MTSLAILRCTVIVCLAAVTPSVAQPSDGSFTSVARFMERDGESLYKNICAACHMPSGEGARGAAAYPALARNAKLQTPAYPVFMVLNGRNAMPAFGRFLGDAQIAAVVNYVRTHFGNLYTDLVSPADVTPVRPRNGLEAPTDPDTDF
jgi:mono/diheme cytochrome c family protein